ncbi:MAG TPA: hypothetical protein VFL38_11605 [Humibacillus xanthopallidus]|nr:hypothetical protein [Humibacillus xanthopallidus]
MSATLLDLAVRGWFRIFEGREQVRLSARKGGFGLTMREAQIGLYREVVDRGWYARHPRARNGRTRLTGLVVLVPPRARRCASRRSPSASTSRARRPTGCGSRRGALCSAATCRMPSPSG